MKYGKYLLAALMIVGCLVGCKKDKVKPEFVTLTVQFDDGNGAKAYMTNYMQPKWQVGDKININGDEKEITKDNNGKFIVEGVVETNEYKAYFFADEGSFPTDTGENGTVKFKLNAEQNYETVGGSGDTIKFGAPMVAKSTNSELKLTFKNTCAVLAIEIENKRSSSIQISNIEVTDIIDNHIIAGGEYIVDYNMSNPEMGSGSNIVTLNCGSNTTISSMETKTFFIYVPPVRDAQFTISVNSGTLFSQTQKKTITLSPGHYVKVPITIKEDQTN